MSTYQITRLKNGLTVATAEMPHMASASLGLWVRTGGRYESKELNGVSHFIEHLLFKGTRRRSAREITTAIEGIGGYLNAFTSEENTCYYAKAHGDHFRQLLDVLMDMLLNSTFPPAEIAKERLVIKEEVALYRDQPQQYVEDLLDEILWPDHPLGRPLTGTEESVDAITRGAMLQYRRAHYLAETSVVVAAGRLHHDQVLQRVTPYARHFIRGEHPKFIPSSVRQTSPRCKMLSKDIAQAQVAIGFRCCSRHDDRRFAMRVLNTLLGENMSSRLFQILREEHGLAYSISSSLSFFDDVGALTVSAGLDPENIPKALKLMAREWKRFVDIRPTSKELRQARDYLIGQLDLGLESTESQMMWVGEHLMAYDKILATAEIKQRLKEVTPAQVRAVARDYLRPDQLNLAVISPLSLDDRLLQHLKF